jgi:hypothetical protein
VRLGGNARQVAPSMPHFATTASAASSMRRKIRDYGSGAGVVVPIFVTCCDFKLDNLKCKVQFTFL